MKLARVLPLLLVAALCACSRGGAPAPSASHLVFAGLGGEPDTLNPLLTDIADVASLSHLYMSLLLDTDDKGNLIPEIAARVPTVRNGDISHDGKTITYHLRPGVRWQDGAPLTARDVVFSAHAVLNPANNVATRVGYDDIASVTATNDTTVVVKLRKPFAPFIAYFFAPQNTPAIMPAHLLARYKNLNTVAYNQAPIGSGPYRVVKWRHGDSITFAANPLYWRGRPQIATLTYRIIADPNTRLQQLRTGEVSAYFDVDPQLLPQARAIPGVRVALTPVNDMHVLRFNLRDPILKDVRVRRAIAMAVDRSQLLEGATHGSGIIVDADQPENGWAYDSHIPSIAFNPAAARSALDAAGWKLQPDGVRAKAGRRLALTLAISPQIINGSPLVASIVQENLRNVGIAVTVKSVPSTMMYAPAAAGGVMASGHFQLAYDAWWVQGPDPEDTWNFGCDQMPPNGQNFSRWCDPKANAAMYAADATYDQAQRKKYYDIVQQAVVSELPVFTLWQVRMPDAYNDHLHGVKPSPFGSEFWNAWSWTIH